MRMESFANYATFQYKKIRMERRRKYYKVNRKQKELKQTIKKVKIEIEKNIDEKMSQALV